MRLRTKLILMLLLAFLLYIGLAYGVVRYVISPIALMAEQAFAKWDADRVVYAIQREADHLGAVTSVWARMDETRQVFTTDAPSTVTRRLEQDIRSGRQFDFAWLLDGERRVVWRHTTPLLDTTDTLSLHGLPVNRWQAEHPLLDFRDTTRVLTGMLPGRLDPALVASSPILGPGAMGAPEGYIVLGKFLDRPLMNRIQLQTHVDFALFSVETFVRPDRENRLDNMLQTGLSSSFGFSAEAAHRLLPARSMERTTLQYYRDSGAMLVIARLRDIFQQESMVLRVNYRRVFTFMGIGASVMVFSSIVLLGMFMSIILLVFVYITVTRPISRLNRHVAAISSSPDLSLRLTLKKSDEIGVLAREYNNMLERLDLDVRRRRKAEEQLKRSEARYRRILSATAEGFCELNPSLEIQDVNDAMCATLGYWRKDILGRSLCDFILEGDRAVALSALTSNDQDHTFFECVLVDARKGEIPFYVNASALRDENNTITGRLAFLTNITELKKAEVLKEDVERITRHDMKTPLMAIISFPQIMKSQPNLTPQQVDFLDRIENAGYRLLNMINLSLDLYKMERKSYTLKAGAVDLLPIMRRIIAELDALCRSLKVQFHLTVRGRPVTDQDTFIIQGDELLCYTMLANLLKNALEASPAEDRVQVDLEENGAFIVRIHNNGAIPQDIRSRFFEKYATAGKENGTGLGAYSAKLIAETHCGKITCETSEDDGTTITIRLPMESLTPEECKERSERTRID